VTAPAALLLLLAASAAAAQPYALVPGGAFAIEGSTVLGGFACHSGAAEGGGEVQSGELAWAHLTVAVGSFECDTRGMTRDLARALDAERHPAVRFTFESGHALSSSASDAWTPVRVTGTLELAGAAQSVRIAAHARRDGQQVLVRGHHELRMTDFGIRPPSGPLGIVRAHDRITVRFALAARPTGPAAR
jgi:polyisoprenoid-binding protein YceI